jgi:hypothetical protein
MMRSELVFLEMEKLYKLLSVCIRSGLGYVSYCYRYQQNGCILARTAGFQAFRWTDGVCSYFAFGVLATERRPGRWIRTALHFYGAT